MPITRLAHRAAAVAVLAIALGTAALTGTTALSAGDMSWQTTPADMSWQTAPADMSWQTAPADMSWQ